MLRQNVLRSADSARLMMQLLLQGIVKTADSVGHMVQFLLQSPCSPRYKSRVLRTEIILFTQRLRNLRQEFKRRKGKASIGIMKSRIHDFEVEAFSFGHLMFLHGQIFRDLEYFFKPKRANPFIVDCGSNIGMSILFFKALYPEARIIGFEPDEQTYRLLERNISNNGLTGVQVHRAALGIEDSTTELFVVLGDPGSLYQSTIRRSETAWGGELPKEKTVVQQVRLSTFIDEKVDLLKLDVEGAEHAVLKDLVSSEVISNIDQMIVEYDHHLEVDTDKLGEFLSQLEKSGFGYQIITEFPGSARISRGNFHQNVLIYAYQKLRSSATEGTC
jgi:FkbM family methyltransferase